MTEKQTLRIPTERLVLGKNWPGRRELDNDVPFRPGAMMDLTSLEGLGQLASTERRIYPRHRYVRKAICQLQAGPPDYVWMMGDSQDISVAGIGFVLHRRFDPGTLLTVDLERPKRDSWGTLQARVMRSTPQLNGHWMLGCALVPALSEEELQKWLNGHGNKAATSRPRI